MAGGAKTSELRGSSDLWSLILPTLTAAQVAFFLAYFLTVTLWLYAKYLHKYVLRHVLADSTADIEKSAEQKALLHKTSNGDADMGVASSKLSSGSILEEMLDSAVYRCLTLDKQALVDARHGLQAMVEFGGLMVWYFLCDRTPLFPQAEKEYSRDVFLFMFLVLVCVAAGSSLQHFKAPLLLNRPQTEEWKGWMQVLFLLYHYFEAREAYNAIRIFIAGYVWMTGFGNFSYYYKTGDFSIGRFCQMMWRLNFLVFFCCVVLNNSYMLYYICPMHTIFTVMVFLALWLGHKYNKSFAWLGFKMVLSVATVFLLWDVKAVFYAIWTPFKWLVAYDDPRRPRDDTLYEWFFRSSLDRYVWVFGMLCALGHPAMAFVLNAIDAMPKLRCYAARTALVATCLALGYTWYTHIFVLPKNDYNKVHPYTSWIPISLFFILRNVTPWMRTVHLRLFGWLGCITLETYISQFHIWLHSDIPDGQPKFLLVLLPGYPLLNFALVSAMYVFVSHRLFELTNALKNLAVPHDNDRLLLRNGMIMGAMCAVAYAAGFGAVQVLRL